MIDSQFTSGDRSKDRRSVYQEAIERTQRTIRSRAQRYRNLAVAVVVVSVGSVAAGLIRWSWYPLLGLGSTVLIYGVFAVSDARLVLAWQREILTLWADHRLELKPLRDALKGIPMMPVRTLDGMLAMLPLSERVSAPEPSALRQALKFVVQECHVLQQFRSLLVGAARLVALTSLVVAIVTWSPLPLVGLAAVPVLLFIGHTRERISRRRWRRQLAALHIVDTIVLRDWLSALDCGGAGSRYVQRLIHATDTRRSHAASTGSSHSALG